MNKEIKQKWIEALRSGKYKQGGGMLKSSSGKYCCLGVLCEVAELEFDGMQAGLTADQERITGVDDLGSLPKAVEQYTKLAHLNDFANYDFNQIADVIEEQL